MGTRKNPTAKAVALTMGLLLSLVCGVAEPAVGAAPSPPHKAYPGPWEPVVTPTPTTAPSASLRPSQAPTAGPSRSLRGTATWFCLPEVSACTVGFAADGFYAAAGPALRAALGPRWRGRTVRVTAADGQTVRVTLTDWCGCGSGSLIDLYAAPFAALAPLSRGRIAVTITY